MAVPSFGGALPSAQFFDQAQKARKAGDMNTFGTFLFSLKLTPAQMKTFGISKPGEPDTDSELAKRVGPGCIWTADSAVNIDLGAGDAQHASAMH